MYRVDKFISYSDFFMKYISIAHNWKIILEYAICLIMFKNKSVIFFSLGYEVLDAPKYVCG